MATVTTEHPGASGPPAAPAGGPGWRKRWPFAAGAVAVLAVIALLWLVLGHDSGPSGDGTGGDTHGEIVVPAVVGKPAAEARRVLEAKGLTVETRQEDDSRAGTHGMVISQKPAGRAYASAGDTVTLLVGREDIVVPDLVNTPVQGAVDALTAQRFVASVAPAADSPYPPGVVASVSPAAGTVVGPGATVTIAPASGYTNVPDLRHMCLADARIALQVAGLQLGKITETIDNDTIYYHEPAAWTNAAHTSVEASGYGRLAVNTPVLVYVTPNSLC
ncbi:MAG TPA: PASTA domain-containing protein [Acidimicrobiales bacterium]|jgi:serine/threonine-protein kinase